MNNTFWSNAKYRRPAHNHSESVAPNCVIMNPLRNQDSLLLVSTVSWIYTAHKELFCMNYDISDIPVLQY